jgi:hypothetical protein
MSYKMNQVESGLRVVETAGDLVLYIAAKISVSLNFMLRTISLPSNQNNSRVLATTLAG